MRYWRGGMKQTRHPLRSTFTDLHTSSLEWHLYLWFLYDIYCFSAHNYFAINDEKTLILIIDSIVCGIFQMVVFKMSQRHFLFFFLFIKTESIKTYLKYYMINICACVERSIRELSTWQLSRPPICKATLLKLNKVRLMYGTYLVYISRWNPSEIKKYYAKAWLPFFLVFIDYETWNLNFLTYFLWKLKCLNVALISEEF